MYHFIVIYVYGQYASGACLEKANETSAELATLATSQAKRIRASVLLLQAGVS